MKKILLASAVVLLAAGGAGGWYILQHREPLQEAKALLAKGDYRAASLQLRTAVRDNPENAEAHALLSQLQLASDDPVAAEREMKQAMALHWDSPGALAVLAQAYMRQGKWAEILKEVPAQAATPEQTAFFLMTRAVAQRGMKDVAAANATLAEAERLAPQNAEIHVAAARFAAIDGKPDVALDEVDRALKIEPDRVDALQLKSDFLAAKGDRDGAIALLDDAIKRAPARNDLLLSRATLLVAKNDDKAAAADVDTVLKRDGKNVPAQFVRMVLLVRQQKFADANLVAQQIDQNIGAFQRGNYFKAMIKAAVGQTSQAEDAITAYISRYPTDLDGLRLLGRIELAAKRPERALPFFKRAVAAGASDTDTLDLLGRLYAMDGKQAEADQVFKQASETASSPAQLAQLASARLQIGDLAGAAGDLQRSLDIAPAQPQVNEALVATAIRLGQLDRAQEALDQLRKQVGETETVGNLSGLLRLARLDPQGALAEFAATAAKFPDSVAARLNQVKVLLQLNRADDAIPLLNAMLEKTPGQVEALTLLSQTLLSKNRGDEAIALAERARKAEPNNVGLINGEAQIYGRMQQFDKGIALIDAARVDGKVPAGLLPTLGNLQLAAGQTDAARKTFADLVATEPNNVPAILTDIEVLTRLKDFGAARKVADDGLQRQPGNLPLLQARVRIDLLDGGVDAAVKTADALRANAANMPAAASLKAGVLMGAQRFADAAAAFETAFRTEPSSTLLLGYAQALLAAGKTEQAASELRKWQASHPDDPEVAAMIGSMDITAHNYSSAERNYQLVLSKQPSNLIALNNLAWLFQQKGDRRAREFAQRAYELAPTPEVSDTLGWILVSQGDTAKALPLLQAAAAQRPANPSIRYHLAVALKQLNRPDEAIGVLRPVADGPENFDEKQAAQTLLAELTKGK